MLPDMRKSRPPSFKWRHFEPAVITCAVSWYLRFSLSYRNVEEFLTERGLSADHTTVWRWVQRYAPELNQRCRRDDSRLSPFLQHYPIERRIGYVTNGATLLAAL